MLQQTAERLLTTSSADIRLRVDGITGRPHRMFFHSSIPKSLMRAISIVESYELLVDMIEVDLSP